MIKKDYLETGAFAALLILGLPAVIAIGAVLAQ